MDQKPIKVKREEGRIEVYFPFTEDSKNFYGPRALGDAVISLKKYLEQYGKDFPRTLPKIDSELEDVPGGEGWKLKDALRGLYAFRKPDEQL